MKFPIWRCIHSAKRLAEISVSIDKRTKQRKLQTHRHTQEKQTFEKSVGNGERRIKANDVSQHLSRENKQTNRSSVVVDIQQRDKEKEPMVKRKKKKPVW